MLFLSLLFYKYWDYIINKESHRLGIGWGILGGITFLVSPVVGTVFIALTMIKFSIKDWRRTVGVNMVINIDKAAEDVGFPKPIIISGKFSGHAKAYANRRGITLLSKQQILRFLG